MLRHQLPIAIYRLSADARFVGTLAAIWVLYEIAAVSNMEEIVRSHLLWLWHMRLQSR